MGEHALTHCLPRLQKVVAGEQGGISAAVGWPGGGGFRCLQLGAPLFDADGDIHPDVRFADLAAFLWLRETGQALAAVPSDRSGTSDAPGTPLLGQHEGTSYWLLFNGVLGDRRPASGNVLTSDVVTALRALGWHDGPKVVYGEACRLGTARLAGEGITSPRVRMVVAPIGLVSEGSVSQVVAGGCGVVVEGRCGGQRTALSTASRPVRASASSTNPQPGVAAIAPRF